MQQRFQIVNHLQQLFAVVRVADHNALRLQFDLRRFRIDIGIVHQYLRYILKGIMGFDADTVRIENQGVAGNTRRSLVRLAETAVYADFFPFRANRAFPFFDLNRRMAVDDMALGRIDAEFMEDFYALIPIPVEVVIVVLRFFPRRLIDDIVD